MFVLVFVLVFGFGFVLAFVFVMMVVCVLERGRGTHVIVKYAMTNEKVHFLIKMKMTVSGVVDVYVNSAVVVCVCVIETIAHLHFAFAHLSFVHPPH